MSRLTYYDQQHMYRLDIGGKKQPVPSVSSLVKTLHQFTNDRWTVGEAALGINAAWDDIASMVPDLRTDAMTTAGLAQLSQARDFGTSVHYYAEQLWGGQPVEVPEQYAAHVQAIADWFNSTGARVLAAEQMVWADAGDFGESPMAGRFDLIVEHPDLGRVLLDLKSWQAHRAGAPRGPQWAMQLAAYSQMEWMVIDGEDQPMGQVDACAVLHVGPGEARLWLLPADDWKRANDQVDAARVLKALPKPTMKEQQ